MSLKVEQAVVTKQPGTGCWAITGRVLLNCELIDPPDGDFVAIRLTEAGAGLQVGAEIVVPAVKLVPE
jgi:hypothetical protein